MRILFDGRWIRSETIDGISRYAANLFTHLARENAEHEYLILGERPVLQQHIEHAVLDNVRIVPVTHTLFSFQDLLFSQRVFDRLQADIVHSPYYISSPLRGSYKKILTVHDLIPLLFPEALSKSRLVWRWFYATRYPLKILLNSADVLITPSEHTKQDIVRLLKIPSERISVVWNGLEPQFHANHHPTKAFWQQYALPSQFILYVGRQDPYKGLSYLVDAYARLPRALQDTYQVVIAGKTDERYVGDVRRRIAEHHLQHAFHFPDYIPDAALPSLYAAATVLVHPSLYEGFGWPPLEAMACGTPVVYADTSSLAEHIGDAGLAVVPGSAESLAEGIQELLQNSSLRNSLSAQGIRHARDFCWTQAARKILRLYARLLQP